MKKLLRLIGYGFFIAGLAGCTSIRAIMPLKTETVVTSVVTPFPSYSGFKARIAVADFDIKTARVTGEIGADLRNILTLALVGSNRFSIAEQQTPGGVIQAQEPAAPVAAQVDTDVTQKEEIKGADLIITAAITEFNPQASGGREGLGGGGGIGSGFLGGLLGVSANKALMALDIRIIDTATSGVLAYSRVQGQASDIAGVNSRGIFGDWDLGAELSAYNETPMEKAIRICVIEAVRYIYQNIPANYYKY